MQKGKRKITHFARFFVRLHLATAATPAAVESVKRVTRGDGQKLPYDPAPTTIHDGRWPPRRHDTGRISAAVHEDCDNRSYHIPGHVGYCISRAKLAAAAAKTSISTDAKYAQPREPRYRRSWHRLH